MELSCFGIPCAPFSVTVISGKSTHGGASHGEHWKPREQAWCVAMSMRCEHMAVTHGFHSPHSILLWHQNSLTQLLLCSSSHNFLFYRQKSSFLPSQCHRTKAGSRLPCMQHRDAAQLLLAAVFSEQWQMQTNKYQLVEKSGPDVSSGLHFSPSHLRDCL